MSSPNSLFSRWFAQALAGRLKRPYVQLVFGARQTGKSTLIRSLLDPQALTLDFSNPVERARFSSDPGAFIALCKGLSKRAPKTVFVDEAQTVPAIFDAVQHLYDGDKNRWRFILCGSSARNLRKAGVNLLPGRAMLNRIFPLVLAEQPHGQDSPGRVVAFPWKGGPGRPFPDRQLEERLAFGALPGIAAEPLKDRAARLQAYAAVHLEEEVRRETLIRDPGAFLRFAQFAAHESGRILNYSAISQETGATVPTIKSYYQLLEDMFLGFRVHAFSGSPRKHMLSTPRFFFFDLGIRNAAAGLDLSVAAVKANPGPLFEQWVGMELWKRLNYLGHGKLAYLRTKDGAEVDFVVEQKDRVTPVEVKWTSRPSSKDARHLKALLKELGPRAKRAYIVCRVPQPMEIEANITALPWWAI